MELKTVLSIAGSDPSGGAGIQADLKTMAAHGVYGMSVVTALTAQNTTGVYGIQEVTPEFAASQLDCVFTDIFPDAVKIGMLFSEEIVRVTARKLRGYRAEHIVLDPVMIATSGAGLLREEAAEVMKEELFSLAEVITPNIPEAEVLAGMKIRSGEEMEKAAEKIAGTYGCAVLCKGGHSLREADDFLFRKGERIWIRGERIASLNTHGTGCTLSSAIASNLALGKDLEEAVRRAKKYLTGALEAGLDLGAGSGPLNHMFLLSQNRQEEKR